jgi:hypothetical protein
MKLSTPIQLDCGHTVRWARILNTARSRFCSSKDVQSILCLECNKSSKVLLDPKWKPKDRTSKL